MKKADIISRFCISKKQEFLLESYIHELIKNNEHTNLVGKSTLLDPWNNHILDSLQVSSFLKNKELSILDMGSGAGLPGVVLSILGYSKITLIDSNGKKINFLNKIKHELGLVYKTKLKRIERLSNMKFDIITSRALAKLDKLISYSQNLSKKNTVLIFLKGKTVNEEIENAKKKWTFKKINHQSLSDSRGSVVALSNVKHK